MWNSYIAYFNTHMCMPHASSLTISVVHIGVIENIAVIYTMLVQGNAIIE